MYDVHSIFLFHKSQKLIIVGPKALETAVAFFPEQGQG